jgi:hypothetical protein
VAPAPGRRESALVCPVLGGRACATLPTRGRLCITLLALGMLPDLARAEDSTVAVNYRAPPDCPDSAELVALLAARAAVPVKITDGGVTTLEPVLDL